jgi:hypothetical protein
MAKGIKTGGRKKGTPNRATAEKAKKIAESGLTPLDFMLDVMRDPAREYPIRMDAAKSAAPYVHPKLASIEHTGADGGPIEVKTPETELARRALFLLAKAAGDPNPGA